MIYSFFIITLLAILGIFVQVRFCLSGQKLTKKELRLTLAFLFVSPFPALMGYLDSHGGESGLENALLVLALTVSLALIFSLYKRIITPVNELSLLVFTVCVNLF